jgi:AcrR family transcriptional regulator
MSTDKRLIAAATALLDSGGEHAVTLRAVAQASGVSHNAPYKHFENRDALLAAVAIEDFAALGRAFTNAKKSKQSPTKKLMKGLRVMLDFSYKHRARYELLFSNPSIAAATGELKKTAGGAFYEFVEIVKECQAAGELPDVPGATVASLLFATMHGLIAIESSGGMHAEKGLNGVEGSLKLLIELIASNLPKRSPNYAKLTSW